MRRKKHGPVVARALTSHRRELPDPDARSLENKIGAVIDQVVSQGGTGMDHAGLRTRLENLLMLLSPNQFRFGDKQTAEEFRAKIAAANLVPHELQPAGSVVTIPKEAHKRAANVSAAWATLCVMLGLA